MLLLTARHLTVAVDMVLIVCGALQLLSLSGQEASAASNTQASPLATLFKGCTQLNSLILHGCNWLTAHDIRALCDGTTAQPPLQQLQVCCGHVVTDADLSALGCRLKDSLQHLVLDQAIKITPQGVAALCKVRRTCIFRMEPRLC